MAQESWQTFKSNFLQAEHSILITQENKQTFQETRWVSQGTHDWAPVQKGHTQDMKVKTHNRNFASLPLPLGKSCLWLKTQASSRKGITSMEKIPGGQSQALYWGAAWEKTRQTHKLKWGRFWLDIMAKKQSLRIIKHWNRLPERLGNLPLCRLRPDWTKPKATTSEFNADIALSRRRLG